MKKRVCVLLAPGYEEIEALTPVDFLRRCEVPVDVVTITDDVRVIGAHEIMVQADTFIDDIQAQDYAMVVIPGGLPGADHLKNDDRVLKLVREVYDQGDYVASICAGPMVLDAAGVLEGKKATCYPGFEDNLPTAAECLGDIVVVDGRIITSRGPGAANYFALALVEALLGKERAQDLKKEIVLDLVEGNLGE